MVRCRTIRRWLLEFASDGIDPAREAAFRAHLDACSGCATEWAEVTAVDLALAEFSAPEPSERFFDQLRDQVNQRLDELPRHPARRRLVPAFSGLAMLILALALGYGPRRGPVRHEPEPVLSTTRMAEAEPAASERAAPVAPAPAQAAPVVGLPTRAVEVTPRPVPRVRPVPRRTRPETRFAAAPRTRRIATPPRPVPAETSTGSAVRNSLADADPAEMAMPSLAAEPLPAVVAAPRPAPASLAVVAELPVARVRAGAEHAFVVAALTDLPPSPTVLVGPRGPRGDRGPAGPTGGAGGMLAATRARGEARVDEVVTAADKPVVASPAVGLEIAPAILECEVVAVTVATRSPGR